MVVKTHTQSIEKHRKTLLELVASENRNIDIDQLSGYASQAQWLCLAGNDDAGGSLRSPNWQIRR